METKFEILKGKILQGVDRSIGHTIDLSTKNESFDLDAILILDKGISLTIYNKHELKLVDNYADFIGSRILDIDIDDQIFKIVFENGSIEVDISDRGYVGPEAMLLRIDNDQFIIWD